SRRRTHCTPPTPPARTQSDSAWPSFDSGIPQDAIPEPAGIVPMNRDPDFLAALRMNEEQVAAFASAPLDEAGRLQLSDHFLPGHYRHNNLSLGYSQLADTVAAT